MVQEREAEVSTDSRMNSVHNALNKGEKLKSMPELFKDCLIASTSSTELLLFLPYTCIHKNYSSLYFAREEPMQWKGVNFSSQICF